MQRKEAQTSLYNTPCFCVNGRYNMCLRQWCRIPTMGAGRSQQMLYICSHPPHSSLPVALGMLFYLIFLGCSMLQTSSCSSRAAFIISTFHFFPWGLSSVSDFQGSTQKPSSWQMGLHSAAESLGRCFDCKAKRRLKTPV